MIDWDEEKRQINITKHGVDFVIAEDFEWPTAVVFEDTRFDYGEVRQIAIGRIATSIYTMVFTVRGATVRVISLRAAHRKERAAYEKAPK